MPWFLLLTGRHEADVDHAGILGIAKDLLDHLVLGGAVRTDLELGLRRLRRRNRELGLQFSLADFTVIEEVRTVRLDREIHRFNRGVILNVRISLRQIDLDLMGHQRCRDHEDDQQNQHHVDERRDVDFRHRTATVAPAAHSHGSVPHFLAATGALPSTRAPVAKKSCRSCANSSNWAYVRRLERMKKLYASTAGIAVNRPNAVMIRASPTGPATLSIEAEPEAAIPIRAW